MRTFLYSALAVATLGLMTLTPASAASHWHCMGPAVACGGSTAKHKTYGYKSRSHGRVYASRGARRASSRRSRSYAVATRSTYRYTSGHRARSHRVADRSTPRRYASSRTEQRPASRRVTSAAAFSRAAYAGSSSQSGMASYYGSESGSRTASGAHFNPGAMTAAHRSLPFGTKVRVTNRRNGRSVVVTINDRGPFIRGRIIDLSSGAAGVIGMRGAGVAPVSLEVLGRS